MLRYCLYLWMIVGALGCGRGSAEIETLSQTYAPGGCVGIVVRNDAASSSVDVDHCYPRLEVRQEDAWLVVALPDSCLLWGLTAQPGQRAGFRERLPIDLTEGTYRYVVPLKWHGETTATEQPTNSFEVAGAAVEEPCRDGEPFNPDDG